MGKLRRALVVAGLAGAAATVLQVARRSHLLGRLYAAGYDVFDSKAEREFLGERRRELLVQAGGRVLEIGVGTGANLAHYPREAGLELVAIDPDPGMLARAKRRAAQLGMAVELHQTGAYPLAFPDASFDTVVCTLCLCTIPDPAEALGEVRRVLRPGGRLLFLEHVRAKEPDLVRWQDRLAPPWKIVGRGCHPNRDTRAAIEASAFSFERIEEDLEARMPVPIVRPLIQGVALPIATPGEPATTLTPSDPDRSPSELEDVVLVGGQEHDAARRLDITADEQEHSDDDEPPAGSSVRRLPADLRPEAARHALPPPPRPVRGLLRPLGFAIGCFPPDG